MSEGQKRTATAAPRPPWITNPDDPRTEWITPCTICGADVTEKVSTVETEESDGQQYVVSAGLKVEPCGHENPRGSISKFIRVTEATP